MMETYENIISYIDELILFFKEIGFQAEIKSHLEDDYLQAHKFYEDYKNNPVGSSDENGRAAFGGLFELYKWVWSVKNCKEFNKLIPHLRLLIEASPRINSTTLMISPVTGKQDDKTNKFVEAIVGMAAVKYGSDVDLDDPVASSDGTNPDVIFTYNGERISIACKTLRGDSCETILSNIKGAAKQIKRADCDKGYILINAMNILKHKKIKNRIFDDHMTPLHILWDDIASKYRTIRSKDEQEILELFSDGKVRPVVVTFLHSVALLNSPMGRLSTSLKATFAIDFEISGIDTSIDSAILQFLNEFIHNR